MSSFFAQKCFAQSLCCLQSSFCSPVFLWPLPQPSPMEAAPLNIRHIHSHYTEGKGSAENSGSELSSSGVNFTNILRATFPYKSVLCSFSLLAVWLCNFFQYILFLKITTLVTWLKSTLLLKIKCFDTHI